VAETALRQDPSVLKIEEVAESLAVDLDSGLSSAEAARRIAADGPNELRGTPPVPIWRKILAQFQDPLIYLLLAAVVISLVAWVLGGRIGWPVDAIVIAVVVILNAVLGYVQEARAESAVAALQEMTAVTSAVLRAGQLARIPSDQLVRGDLIVLAEGDAVGADARLTEAAALRVLEASLTGESEAVEKNVSALPGPAALADRHCMVYTRAPPSPKAADAPSSLLPGWRRKWGPSPACWKRRRRSPHHYRSRSAGSDECWDRGDHHRCGRRGDRVCDL